jgi:sulfide:quinone oxidoreductase
LLFVPNIPSDVMENRDPALHQRMQLRPALASDDITFIQDAVKAVDIVAKTVAFLPNERPGEERETLSYDYLVIAMSAHLAYDRIPGFAEYGHTVSDLFHGERLRQYLYEGGYKGGPVVIGAAHFHQGDSAEGLQPYPGASIPYLKAACEGPILEMTTSMANWFKRTGNGTPDKITVFTPDEIIAADAGVKNVEAFLAMASGMGIHYRNNMPDITRLTTEGVEFVGGETLEAEIKLILPDWVAHECLRDLPICDSMGFIKTNLLMRNQDHPEIFALGDCAAVTVPKIGGIGHQEFS